MITLEAPLFIVLIDNPEQKHYLTFNNYHKWPPALRTKIRRAYCDLIKKQLEGMACRYKGDTTCRVEVFPPKDGRERDADNHGFLHAKWTTDALTEVGCWVDDHIVRTVTLAMGSFDNKHPRATISYMPSA